MAVGDFLRFGLVGTLVLAALPLCFVARYVLSHQLAQYTVDTRPLDDGDHERLEVLFEETGLSVSEVIVVTGVETQVAGLSGMPWNRLVLLSETTLETTTDGELRGLVGIVAGKHEVWFPELYAGYLTAASTALVVFLGVDPSGLPPVAAVLVVVVLLVIVGLGLQVLRRRVYAADQAAVRRVGRDPVEAALDITLARQPPAWVPDIAHPKPPLERRHDEL